MVKIAVDAMGGDHGIAVTVPASLVALKCYKDLSIILVGDQKLIRQALEKNSACEDDRLSVMHAPDSVSMDDSPVSVLRNKLESSIHISLRAVKDGIADGVVSGGNTGALMALSKYILRSLPGIERPAICTALPTYHGCCHVLDLGANSECNAVQLLQFAIMGSELVKAVKKISNPKVGLINIGKEEIKGNDLTKHTHMLLKDSDLNYIGFVEGDDLYLRDLDVVVCDGFVGNIILKVSEGLLKFELMFIKETLQKNFLSKLLAFIIKPILKRSFSVLNPDTHNGAALLGVNGIVVKSHGGAGVEAFSHAIHTAFLESNQDVLSCITSALETRFAEYSS